MFLEMLVELLNGLIVSMFVVLMNGKNFKFLFVNVLILVVVYCICGLIVFLWKNRDLLSIIVKKVLCFSGLVKI